MEGGAKGLDYKPAGRHAGEALSQHFAKVLTVGWVVAKVVSCKKTLARVFCRTLLFWWWMA